MREDMYTWLAFLDNFSDITSFKVVYWWNYFDLELFTGVIGNVNLRYGAAFNSIHWVYLAWSFHDQWNGSDNFSGITFLE